MIQTTRSVLLIEILKILRNLKIKGAQLSVKLRIGQSAVFGRSDYKPISWLKKDFKTGDGLVFMVLEKPSV